MSDWFDRAVVYQILPDVFRDASGNGHGDLDGIRQALDYLVNLGVTCLWLAPIYTSPRRDDGYDIADYYSIDSRFGSAGDLVRLLEAAESRQVRVIIDISFSHTSNEHPWFKEARSDRDSEYRDYYVWADEPVKREGDVNLVGVGRVWTFDEEAGQYYHHSFYPHQPDLNPANERLQGEISKIIGYWLRLGVSGFRLDAVPHMIKPVGSSDHERGGFELLAKLRRFIIEQNPDAVLVGEVDADPPDYAPYFGGGDRLQEILNFYLPGNAFLALAERDAKHIRHVFEALPRPPAGCQYANFLRNHDELDLERLSAKDRNTVLEEFAPEENMQIYGRGSRRRLAPMLGGDMERIRLAHSLLLSLPGTPVLYYGDEIGMGEDLSQPERDSVRTPMQWSHRANGGFSTAAPEKLAMPPIDEGPFSYEKVNVAAQLRHPGSLLDWVQRAVAARRLCPEIGRGEPRFFDAGEASVLVQASVSEGRQVLVLHNLGDEELEVALKGDEFWLGELLEIFSDQDYPNAEGGTFALAPYGFRWFRTTELPA
ncbi:MAG TPA: alpha-amylase family protein [Trueperaceae bacterium]|nr:alpha-amylase family protein [Trueperaceae bacterium]